MDVQPTELHQRVPFICGSTNMVEELEEFMIKYGE
jgi:fructose-1,6-bisphosphatase I